MVAASYISQGGRGVNYKPQTLHRSQGRRLEAPNTTQEPGAKAAMKETETKSSKFRIEMMIERSTQQ